MLLIVLFTAVSFLTVLINVLMMPASSPSCFVSVVSICSIRHFLLLFYCLMYFRRVRLDGEKLKKIAHLRKRAQQLSERCDKSRAEEEAQEMADAQSPGALPSEQVTLTREPQLPGHFTQSPPVWLSSSLSTQHVTPDLQAHDEAKQRLFEAYASFQRNIKQRQQFREVDVALKYDPQQLVGRQARVYWPDDDGWYAGKTVRRS